jgi:hypothetical protein
MLKLCACILAGCGLIGAVTYYVFIVPAKPAAPEKLFQFEPLKDTGNQRFKY